MCYNAIMNNKELQTARSDGGDGWIVQDGGTDWPVSDSDGTSGL